MSLKLKVMGLGILAALSVSAVSVMNASATTGGHFTSDVSHTLLSGSDVAGSPTVFTSFGRTISCPTTSYTGTTNATTVTEITITPTYGTPCNHSLGEAHVNMNNCDYLFTIGKKAVGDNTVHLDCPGASGPTITVTAFLTECVIEVSPDQTPSGGVAFETATSGSPAKHHITANSTVSGVHAVVTKDSGLCPLNLGETEANGTLVGKATVKGFETNGTTQVGITATGSEG